MTREHADLLRRPGRDDVTRLLAERGEHPRLPQIALATGGDTGSAGSGG